MTIERVVFHGLEKTSRSTALRCSRLNEGQQWSESQVEQSRQNLLASGLFRQVNGPLVLAPDATVGRVILEFQMAEKRQSVVKTDRIIVV